MTIKKSLSSPAPVPYTAGVLRIPTDPLALAALAARFPDSVETGCQRLAQKSKRLARLAAKARKSRRERFEDYA